MPIRTLRRAIPLAWLIVVGQAAVATKRHWDMLERKELGRLLKKLKLGRLGRDVAGIATGARRGKKH